MVEVSPRLLQLLPLVVPAVVVAFAVLFLVVVVVVVVVFPQQTGWIRLD